MGTKRAVPKENKWYKDFFEKYYLSIYFKKEAFKNTQEEVKFIIKTLNLPKGAKILDLACGQGRHTIGLAKRGYEVIGLDLNNDLLNVAKKDAKKEKVKLRLIQGDMRGKFFKNEFDAVINLFSSFGYFENEQENIKVLENINKSLKSNGKFLIDLLNKKWFLRKFHSTKRTWFKIKNDYILEENYFDKKMKAWIRNISIISSKNSKIKRTKTFMRLYDFSEIKDKLEKIGFKILRIYGDYQCKKFTSLSPRLIILAQKKKGGS